MSDLYLDPTTRDIWVGPAGDTRLTADIPEAAAQEIAIDLQTFTGEWFLDLSAGVPYYREVLISNPDIPALRVLLRDRIARQAYVAGVSRLDIVIDRVARSGTVEFSAQLVSGDELTVQFSLGLLTGLLSSTGIVITVNGILIGVPE